MPEITEADFIVTTESGDPVRDAWARAGAILVDRPSPAAVAEALSQRLELVAGSVEREALAWLAGELGGLGRF